ncbi:MAG: cyclic peptide export ABC transporter [Bacteroidota bacterium]
MKKIKRIVQLSEKHPLTIFFLALIGVFSGLTGFAFIYLINKVTKLLINGELSAYDHGYILAFGVCILTFVLSRRILSKQVILLSQNVFWNIRKQMVALLSRSKYTETQDLREEIYASIHHDAVNLTNGSMVVINMITQIVLVLTCMVYMAVFCWQLFGFTILAMIGGISIYQWAIVKNNRHFEQSRKLEANFLKYFDALFHGLKEINVAPQKGIDLQQKHIHPIIQSAHQTDVKGYVGYLNSMIVGQLAFYVLIAFILLHLGFVFGIEKTVVINFVFILLYVLGPIENIMVTIPTLNKAAISINKMLNSMDRLREEDRQAQVEETRRPEKISKLELKKILYTYDNKEGFHLGPIDFVIKAPEIVFIYGGNGSGKSTLIKVLLQLYREDGGQIIWDGKIVSQQNRDFYRKHFAVVFSDFYLFDAFYGIETIDETLLAEYLQLFEVDHKVTIEDGKFSTIHLSTGQRKRLAIISALMENKPVLVLDEWAADQDPVFRKKFYTEILPIIKQKGISIVAITHDDAYYHCSDRIYRMDYGQITEVDAKVPDHKGRNHLLNLLPPGLSA